MTTPDRGAPSQGQESLDLTVLAATELGASMPELKLLTIKGIIVAHWQYFKIRAQTIIFLMSDIVDISFVNVA